MYSVVLMTAMMSSPATPEGLFHKGGGCCGQPACCQPTCQPTCCESGGGGKRMKKHRGGGCGCCGECGHGCGTPCCAPVQACGCCGGAGGYAMPMQGGGAPAPAPAPAPKPGPAPATMANPNAATVVVTGAKGANVLIGGLVTEGGDDTRTLVSPALEPGQVYHYDVTAEIVRDGTTVRLTRAVNVRAGETSEVKLDFTAGQVVMK